MLDDIQPGILLIKLYRMTGEEKYKKALKTLMDVLEKWPVNPDGGRWHKLFYKDQMWLDGFYMVSPLLVRYGIMFENESLIELAHKQMCLMRDNMRDPETGLFYHACDFSKQAVWANKETGLSAEFWGRAMGWYVVAAVDIASYLPESHTLRGDFINVATDLLKSLVKYQEKTTGLWYQVVNKGHLADNWVESSCSALYTYALSKAIRLGWLDDSYKQYADAGYAGVTGMTEVISDGTLTIPRICIGTCLGGYKFYVNRSTQVDMLIGVGAFLLMCNEYHELIND